MKKVSAKLFFSVMWKGVCQVMEWLFGLFGYKKEGFHAWCLWRLFATSASIVLGLLAVVFVYSLCDTVYDKYYKDTHCYDPDCPKSEFIAKNIYYHDSGFGKNYVFNSQTKERPLRNLSWIAMPRGADSLVCFCDGEKRGYFNKHTGEVVIPAQYHHAWVFSEGLASVEENGSIKFIDSSGKTVIDNVTAYKPKMEGLVFHGGYCLIATNDGELYGLMNKKGEMILPQEYSFITSTDNYGLWCVKKGDEMAVFNKDLVPIIPYMKGLIYIDEGTIEVTMPDHTMRKYDMNGTLINDFYIASVRTLEYEKDEILYRRAVSEEVSDDGEVKESSEMVAYHPTATARLRAYVAGDSHEGLMTADGHVVTMPLYKEIEAIDHDLYICTSTNYDKVIVNGKGEIVK